MVELEITNRRGAKTGTAKFDDADLPLVAGLVLRMNCGYPAAYIDGKTTLIHRLLLGLSDCDPREVDHINRDRSDNRRANLRIVTHAQNLENKSLYKNSKTGHRGITWDPVNSRWRARVQRNGKAIYLAYFRDLNVAAAAVSAARASLMPFCEDARC